MSPRILIIGAGPAGLAAARWIARSDLDFQIVDRHDQMGGMWDPCNPGTPLYERLHPITSRLMSSFTGRELGHEGYPTHRELLAYIRETAQRDGTQKYFHGKLGVERIAPSDDGSWLVSFTQGHEETFKYVIVARGGNRIPSLPPWVDTFSGDFIHASSYKTADSFKGKRVLVVGAGNSGFHIASDLVSSCELSLAISHPRWLVPCYADGVPTDYPMPPPNHGIQGADGHLEQVELAKALRDYNAVLGESGMPAPSGLPFERGVVVCSKKEEDTASFIREVLPRIRSASSDYLTFQNGLQRTFDAVIAATGYRVQPFVAGIPLFDPPDQAVCQYVPGAPGIFTIGNINSDLGGFWVYEVAAQLIAGVLMRASQGLHEIPPPALVKLRDLHGGIKFAQGCDSAAMVHGRTYLLSARMAAASLGIPLMIHPAWEEVL